LIRGRDTSNVAANPSIIVIGGGFALGDTDTKRLDSAK
jgi:hypothetical protein